MNQKFKEKKQRNLHVLVWAQKWALNIIMFFDYWSFPPLIVSSQQALVKCAKQTSDFSAWTWLDFQKLLNKITIDLN